jgi:hypothetical protein
MRIEVPVFCVVALCKDVVRIPTSQQTKLPLTYVTYHITARRHGSEERDLEEQNVGI